MKTTGASFAPIILPAWPRPGVDVIYILTRRRGGGAWLDEAPSDLLSNYLSLPAGVRAALESLARSLRDQFDRPHAGIVDRQSGYEAGIGGAEPRRPRGKE